MTENEERFTQMCQLDGHALKAEIHDWTQTLRNQIEELEDERHQLQEGISKLRQDTSHPPEVPTLESITEHCASIASQMQYGDLSPDKAKTALYALQVALTALRAKQQAEQQRQKEERLRHSKAPARSTSSKTGRNARPVRPTGN